MKKLYLTLYILLSVSFAQAQLVSNNGGHIYIGSDAKIHVGGDVFNASAGTIVNNGILEIKGSSVNNGTLSLPLGSSLNYIGNAVANIGGSEPIVAQNVLMNNTGGITLNTPLHIQGTLTFDHGVIDATDNAVVFGNTANSTGVSDYSHVKGHIIKQGTGNFSFPVGDGVKYQKIDLDLTTNADGVGVRYYTGDAGTGEFVTTGNQYTPLASYNTGEYWRVDPIGMAAGTVTVYWDGYNDASLQDVTDRKVAYKNGLGKWENAGGEGDGSLTIGQITSLPFASLVNGYFTTGVLGEDPAVVRYVKTESDGGSISGDGMSWANASSDLQAMIDAVHHLGGGEIWVAKGKYISPVEVSMQDQDGFVMRNNVAIYGGFAGYETLLNQRNWKNNVTILSGDNRARVINNPYSSDDLLNNSAVLDGFTLTAGSNINPPMYRGNTGRGGAVFNSYASPVFRNLIITDSQAEWGGGMYIMDGSPLIENVTISNNKAKGEFSGIGGGLFVGYGQPQLKNVIISGNEAESSSGGIEVNTHAHPVLTNVLITGNVSLLGGGMSMYYSGADFESKATLINVTISGNYALLGSGIYHVEQNPDITIFNSIIWGNSGSANNNMYLGKPNQLSANNLIQGKTGHNLVNGKVYSGNAASIFMNPITASEGSPVTGGDYQLVGCSPAINTGDNSKHPQYTEATDLLTNPRVTFGTIDMGAYEFHHIPEPKMQLPADKTYKVGDELRFTVNYTVPVTVTGSPVLPLTIGSIVKNAVYSSGLSQNPAEIVFSYTVAEGDEDTNGIAIASTIELNGGSMVRAGTPANLNYCAVSTTGIKVDGIRPSVTSSKIASDHTNPAFAKTGNVITLTFTSSESVNTPQVLIAGQLATVSVAVQNSTTQWKATYTLIGTETEGIIPFVIKNLTDKNGNVSPDITATTDQSKVTFDKTAPVAPVIQSPTNGTTLLIGNPQISGTGEVGSVTTIYLDGQLLGHTTVNSSGIWTLTPEEDLSNGPHILEAMGQDAAGNSSPASNTVSFIVNVSPTISVSGSLSALSATYGTASVSTSFQLSGTNMTEGILVTPPSGFEVSSNNQDFYQTLLLGSSGLISGTVYIRLKANTAAGQHSGNITLSSAGADNKQLSVPVSTIHKKALTALAKPVNRTYNGTTAVTLEFNAFTVSQGLVGTDDVYVVYSSANFANKHVGSGKAITIVGLDLAGQAKNNYMLNSFSIEGSVVSKPIVVKARKASKTYDGTAVSPLAPLVEGLENGDVVQTAPIQVFDNKNAGTGKTLTASGLVINDGNGGKNYSISYATNAEGIITPAVLGVKAENKNKMYGDNDPALTYTVNTTDLRPGDLASIVTGSLSRVAGENVGIYAIQQGTLQAGQNYTIDFTGANLTISPATLIVKAETKRKVYSETDPILTYTATGFKRGDNTAIFSGSLVREAGEDVNTYVIYQGNLKAGMNYIIQYTEADLTIEKAQQTIHFADPGVLTRDAGIVALDVSSSSGLPVVLSVDDPSIATVSGTNLHVHRLGTVIVTATQEGDHNYHPAEAVFVDIQIANDAAANMPVIVHKAVSPNGDGINDFLMIEGIRDYPDNRVTIFDKSGKILAEIDGYDNQNNVFTGQYVHDGTYYYYLDLKDTGRWKREKGFFVVRR